MTNNLRIVYSSNEIDNPASTGVLAFRGRTKKETDSASSSRKLAGKRATKRATERAGIVDDAGIRGSTYPTASTWDLAICKSSGWMTSALERSRAAHTLDGYRECSERCQCSWNVSRWQCQCQSRTETFAGRYEKSRVSLFTFASLNIRVVRCPLTPVPPTCGPTVILSWAQIVGSSISLLDFSIRS